MEQISTAWAIAGGGPAGMMLGYLLARAEVDVTLPEKHKDILRYFRGDMVHPSTLEIRSCTNWACSSTFSKCPTPRSATRIHRRRFSRVCLRSKFVALMPLQSGQERHPDST